MINIHKNNGIRELSFFLVIILLAIIVFAAAPVVDSINLSSSAGYNSTVENITALIGVSDGDSDSIKNITNWYVNGGSIAVLNLPFENNGTSTLHDYSSYSKDGTNHGATFNSTGGYDGKGAYSTNGVDEYIITENIAAMSEFTLSFWCKLEDNTENGCYLSKKANDNPGNSWMTWANGTRIGFAGWPNEHLEVIDNYLISIANNEWFLYTVTVNNTNYCKIYLNGEEKGGIQFSDQADTVSDSIGIGAYNIRGTPQYKKGTYDDIQIFNRALSNEQISALYTFGTNLIVSNETDIGENWSACVTPNDGSIDGVEVCSSNMTILSTSPVVNNVYLNSTSGTNYTNENITGYWTISHPLGTATKNITNWYVNGESWSLAHLPFETDGSNNVTDYSGNQDGTIVGATWGSDYGYDGQGGFSFSGAQNGIRINPYTHLYPGTKSFTMSVRFKYTETCTTTGCSYDVIFGTRDFNGLDTTGKGLIVGLYPVTGGDIYMDVQFADATAANFVNTVIVEGASNYSDWRHLVFVRDTSEGKIKIYLDNELVKNVEDTTSDIDAFAGVPTIGMNPVGSQWKFKGYIDEFQWFNRALSAGQISALNDNRTDLIVNQETEIGENWSVCITPNDGVLEGSKVCSNNLTIATAIPVVSNVYLNSTSGTNYTNENITGYWTISHPLGTATKNITNWYVNGESIAVLNLPFENNGTSTLHDYSSHSNDGVNHGATWDPVGGYDGKGGYNFDGNDYITISDENSLDLTEEITIETWIYPLDINEWDSLIRKGAGTAGVYYLYKAGSNIRLAINDVGWDTGTATLSSANQWYYLVGTFDGLQRKIYINGELKSTIDQVTNINTNFGDITVGYSGASEYFQGTIDEVQIYNRALSAEQIMARYLNRSDLIVSQETSAGENWSACITPNDGIIDGVEVCSINLTIATAIPVVSNVYLNSTSGTNYTNENITGYWTISHPLGTATKNITNWYVDGSSITVLNMPFEGGSNSTYTKDYSGYSRTLSLNNAVWNSTGGYDRKGAYEFVGANNYIDVGQVTQWDYNGDYSISVWIKAPNEDTSADQLIIGKYSAGSWGSAYIYLAASSDSVAFRQTDNSPAIPIFIAHNGSNDYSDGNWHHIVGVREMGDDAKLYVDGYLVARGADTHATNFLSQNLVIGNDATNVRNFKGSIDDVQIFNRALSAEQISALYNNRTDLIVSQETSVGENWSACITPNDGTEDGNEVCSGNLTVVAEPNIVPEISNLILNSTLGTNYTSENITAYWSATDADNDAVKNITNWYVDGAKINLVNFPLDGGALAESNTKVRDYAAGNNATIIGATYSSTAGFDGLGAYTFDGNGDYLTSSFTPTSSFTISAWFKQTDDAQRTFLSLWDFGTANTRASFVVDDGNDVAYWDSGQSWQANTGFNPTSGTWYHFAAIVIPGTSLEIFINGASEVLDNSFASLPAGLDTLVIGAEDGDVAEEWIGTIDDVQIFNRPLSPEQILALYNNRTDLIVSQETSVGNNWSACITPNDGTEDGNEVCSSNLTIIEEIPIVSAIEIEGGTKGIGDVLQVNITADRAGYTESAITVNGKPVTGFTDWGTKIYSVYYTIEEGDTETKSPTNIAASVVLNNSYGGTNTPFTTVTQVNGHVSIDSLRPILTTVTISSNNPLNSSYAIPGDTISVAFRANEAIYPTPNFTINGFAADDVNFVGSLLFWTATRLMQPGDTEGIVNFTIGFNDSHYNDGLQVSSITEGTNVTFDSTAPFINLTYPLAIAYTSAVTVLNYTNGSSSNSCWYSVNGGVTNVSITCGTNVTGLSASKTGTYTWKVYTNDLAGNVNTSSVSFTINLPVVNSPSGRSSGGGSMGGPIINYDPEAESAKLKNFKIKKKEIDLEVEEVGKSLITGAVATENLANKISSTLANLKKEIFSSRKALFYMVLGGVGALVMVGITGGLHFRKKRKIIKGDIIG